MIRKKSSNKLATQIRRLTKTEVKEKEFEGNFKNVISTGSTLLDLAISGGIVHGGGMPGGILVEAFGPSGAGKTVLLSEIAGAVQRKGGELMFRDPEARLNKQFAKIFGLDADKMNYDTPDKIPEVFEAVRNWQPSDKKIINGVFADSLAALSTDMEMDNKEGDKMGGRRAKEFSEELRRTCRLITKNNYLMVCSNQIRENMGAGAYAEKFSSPGGKAIGFYSSLRLKFNSGKKITVEKNHKGKKIKRVIGITTEIEVYKSSIWKPYHKASVTIIFDYGIDDIRENLQFVKSNTGSTVYCVNDRKLDRSLDESIALVEEHKLEKELKEQTIALWEMIEKKFDSKRKPKIR